MKPETLTFFPDYCYMIGKQMKQLLVRPLKINSMFYLNIFLQNYAHMQKHNIICLKKTEALFDVSWPSALQNISGTDCYGAAHRTHSTE